MTILESLKENVLENFPNQIVYPNKTQDLLAYCEKNVDLITEAYELDLAEGSDRHTKMMISQHYYGNRRQTKNIELQIEQWIHTNLVEMLSKDKNNIEKAHIKNLFNLWKEVCEGSTHETNQSFLENLTINRASYSKFSKEEIDAVKIEKILGAANGITPSLGNNFHYRVDVLPQDVKDAMYPYMHGTFDNCTQETQNEFEENYLAYSMDEWREKGICFNHQFEAPVVLAYSIPVPVDSSHNGYWTTDEFTTGKEATLVGLGLNMWNAICTVEELGLNSCCLKAYNPKALETFDTKTSEELPEGWKWQPYIFLCIGKGIQAKGDHRKYKPRGITNTLEFEVAA